MSKRFKCICLMLILMEASKSPMFCLSFRHELLSPKLAFHEGIVLASALSPGTCASKREAALGLLALLVRVCRCRSTAGVPCRWVCFLILERRHAALSF